MGLRKQTLLFLIFLSSFSGLSQTFQVTRIPMQPSGDGLIGYADVTMRAGCMGEPRLQVKIDRLVIEAVRINGERISSSIGDVSFPMEAKSGLLYMSGYFQNPNIGANQKIHLQDGTISIMLGGFMDWLTVSERNQEIHEMSCPEWKEFAVNDLSRFLSGDIKITREDCVKADWNNTCLFYELKELYKEQQRKEEQKAAESTSSWRDSASTSEEEEEEESTQEEEEDESDISEDAQASSSAEKESSSYASSESSTRSSRSQTSDYERTQRYLARKQSQNRQNEQIAASSAAATGTFLYMLGGFVYSKYGKTHPERLFSGSNFFANVDLGFGLTVHPLYFASEYETPDYDYLERTKGSTSILFDLNVAMDIGYDTEMYGGYGFVTVSPGISPIFDATQFNWSAGARAFGGLKNIKVFGEYETGGRNYTASNFLDSQEYGSGETNYRYSNIKAGIKLSWYGSRTAPARNHIYLGLIQEKINDINEGQSIQRITDVEYGEVPTYTGYMFEWRHDHHGILYARVFPKYPYTGQRGGSNDSDFNNEDGTLFFQVGFLRSFTGFF